MSTAILGIVLIVVGVIAIMAGIGGGIAKMVLELKQQARASSFGLDDVLPAKTIEALAKFLEALIKAPIWLALVIVGILLVAWGGSML